MFMYAALVGLARSPELSPHTPIISYRSVGLLVRLRAPSRRFHRMRLQLRGCGMHRSTSSVFKSYCNCFTSHRLHSTHSHNWIMYNVMLLWGCRFRRALLNAVSNQPNGPVRSRGFESARLYVWYIWRRTMWFMMRTLRNALPKCSLTERILSPITLHAELAILSPWVCTITIVWSASHKSMWFLYCTLYTLHTLST